MKQENINNEYIILTKEDYYNMPISFLSRLYREGYDLKVEEDKVIFFRALKLGNEPREDK